MQKQKSFLCTRSRLATQLIEAGYSVERTVNPFEPNRCAWLIPIDSKMAAVVKKYYDEIGAKYPAFLREQAAAGEGERK